MTTTIRTAFTGDHVLRYDQKSQKAGWLDPEIVFGLAWRRVAPGETVLDVGVGTGLSSILFHKAGLRVVGLDFSSEMLAVCQSKGFAAELREHDVSRAPYPFGDASFDHAVCTGVMHLFSDLGTLFSEVARIMKPGGVFCFVVAHAEAENASEETVGCCEGKAGGVRFHRHSEASVNALYDRCGFEHVQSLRFISSSIGGRERTYRACLAQRR